MTAYGRVGVWRSGGRPTRPVVKELDATVPKDWDIIVAGGHCFSFAMTHLCGRPAGKYHIPIDFGAIGLGLPAAIGVAAARNDGKVMLIDGDGSLYQHIQELETVQRHGMKLLICIINDGGYGAETHKFRAHGVDPMHATPGRGDLAQIARGFGLNGTKVTSLGQFEGLFREHQGQDGSSLWDVHVDDLIPSRNFRRVHFKEADFEGTAARTPRAREGRHSEREESRTNGHLGRPIGRRPANFFQTSSAN